MKQNLLDLNYEDLKSFLNSKLGIEEKKLNMRAQQIFTAVYQKGLNNFNQLTTIPIEKLEIIDLPGLISSDHNNHGSLNKNSLQKTAENYIKNKSICHT